MNACACFWGVGGLKLCEGSLDLVKALQWISFSHSFGVQGNEVIVIDIVILHVVQHSSGHFAGLCSSSKAAWGVPKLIHLYTLLS